MSWFTEQLSKAENFLNKIDQRASNVLNNSNDLISTKINDDNEFIVSTNSHLANSQSFPQLKSIYISSEPDLESNKNEFKYGHSRESSNASYHGLTMKDTSNLNTKYNATRLTKPPINDAQLIDYLNNKQVDLNYSLNNYLTVDNGPANLNETAIKSNGINQDSQPLNTTQLNVKQSSAKQSEAIKNVLKEEKRKLNELKTEYKQHTESEASFLKVKLDEYQIKKDLQIEIDSPKRAIKI